MILFRPQTDLQRSAIINGYNHSYYHDMREGILSVKTMRGGSARYDIHGGQFSVDDDHYLILNHDQPYVINIDAVQPVESFCVFIPAAWAADALRGALTPDDTLLLNPTSETVPVNFFERVQPHDAFVTPVIQKMQAVGKTGRLTDTWLEETVRHLLLAMLHVERDIYREIERLPAAKAATRAELYRRLLRARDYLHTRLGENVTIEDIAAVAYLSPFHLIRAFKTAFGQTPHQYLTGLRIERAAYLLRCTELPITEICYAVGYESPGTFSTLFKTQMGVSPRGYRGNSRS